MVLEGYMISPQWGKLPMQQFITFKAILCKISLVYAVWGSPANLAAINKPSPSEPPYISQPALCSTGWE